ERTNRQEPSGRLTSEAGGDTIILNSARMVPAPVVLWGRMVIEPSPRSRLGLQRALLLAAAFSSILASAPVQASPVTSAANIPYSGASPGGVDMATGELILVLRPDLYLDGPFPVEFRRYYASMLSREGLASGHIGPNWLGTYDWKLTVGPT